MTPVCTSRIARRAATLRRRGTAAHRTEDVLADVAAPFSGIKRSGSGWSGGPEGIQEYLDARDIALPESGPGEWRR